MKLKLKVIFLLVALLVLFGFSSCQQTAGDEVNTEHKGNSGEKAGMNSEDYGVTYPILFFKPSMEGDGSDLYHIKEYGQTPVLVDGSKSFDGETFIEVNPAEPNKILRYDDYSIYEMLLDTAPNTERWLVNRWTDKSAGCFSWVSYTANGKYKFARVRHYYDGGVPDGLYFYGSKIKGIERIVDVNACIFDDETSKMFYIDSEADAIKYVDFETGWTDELIKLPKDDYNYYFLNANKDAVYITDWSDWQNGVYSVYKCNVDDKSFDFVCECNENYQMIFYDKEKNIEVSYTQENKNDTQYEYKVCIQDNSHELHIDEMDKKEYINIFSIDNGSVLCAYRDDSKSEMLLIEDGKEKIILSDSRYKLLQPLNGNEFLLMEYTENGMENLVVYNKDKKEFICAYEGWNNDFDIIFTYPWEKVISYISFDY